MIDVGSINCAEKMANKLRAVHRKVPIPHTNVHTKSVNAIRAVGDLSRLLRPAIGAFRRRGHHPRSNAAVRSPPRHSSCGRRGRLAGPLRSLGLLQRRLQREQLLCRLCDRCGCVDREHHLKRAHLSPAPAKRRRSREGQAGVEPAAGRAVGP